MANKIFNSNVAFHQWGLWKFVVVVLNIQKLS